MLPVLACKNSSHSGACNSKLLGCFFSWHASGAKLANLNNLGSGNNGRGDIFPSGKHGTIFPSFLHHVVYVVGWSANEQMIRIDTKSHIALVADKHVILDRPEVQRIGKTMGKPPLHADAGHAIAAGHFSTSPKPTTAGRLLVDVFPEAIKKWAALVMAVDKGNRFAFDPSVFCNALVGKSGFLTAATFAIAGLDFVKRELELNWAWGILRHVDYLLLGIGQAGGCDQQSPGIPIGL